MLLQRHEEAIPYLERAAELNPRDWTCHHHLALANDCMEDYDTALRHYIRARQLNPELPADILENMRTKALQAKLNEISTSKSKQEQPTTRS